MDSETKQHSDVISLKKGAGRYTAPLRPKELIMSYKECSKDCQIRNDAFCTRYGATPDEWEQAERSILMPWIIPIYDNPEPPSYLSARGKIPSVLNDAGRVVGLTGWTKREPNTDLSAWKSDPDYGFGVRCGCDGLFGLDVDCDDADKAKLAKTLFESMFGAVPYRTRGDSPRLACVLQFTDDKPIKFEPIKDGNGNMVEIRGTGQQIALAGTHPKGERYTWSGDLGNVLKVDREKFNRFWMALANAFGMNTVCVDGTVSARRKGDTVACDDPIADWLLENWNVYGYQNDGGLCVECPWEDSHSGRGANSSTVYFPIGTNGYKHGGFKCMHGHCSERTFADFVNWAKQNGYVEAPTACEDADEDAAPTETETEGKVRDLIDLAKQNGCVVAPTPTATPTATEYKSLIEKAVDAVFNNDYQFIMNDRIDYGALIAKVRRRSAETGEIPFILKALDVSKNAVVVRHVKVKRGDQTVNQDVFGGFATNTEMLTLWLTNPSYCGIELAWDCTCGFVYREDGESDWKAYDIGESFTNIKPFAYGFEKSPKANEITTLAVAAAKKNRIDLLRDTVLKLIPKPGEYERGKVDRFMRDIIHAVTPEGCDGWYEDYLIAISRYMWAGYYARLTESGGLTLRTIPVFKSGNHSGKNAMCDIMGFRDYMDRFPSCFKPSDDHGWETHGLCGTGGFDEDSRTFANNTHGKTVVIFPELGGLNRADANKIKDFITNPCDVYNEKYIAGNLVQIRRWFPIMNTNEDRFLSKLLGDTRLFKIEIAKSEDLGRGERMNVIELDTLSEWLLDLLAEGRDLALEAAPDSLWKKQTPIIAGTTVLNDALMKYGEKITALAQFEDADDDVIEDTLRRLPTNVVKAGVSILNVVKPIREASGSIANNKINRIMTELGWSKRHTKKGNLWFPPENWFE